MDEYLSGLTPTAKIRRYSGNSSSFRAFEGNSRLSLDVLARVVLGSYPRRYIAVTLSQHGWPRRRLMKKSLRYHKTKSPDQGHMIKIKT